LVFYIRELYCYKYIISMQDPLTSVDNILYRCVVFISGLAFAMPACSFHLFTRSNLKVPYSAPAHPSKWLSDFQRLVARAELRAALLGKT